VAAVFIEVRHCAANNALPDLRVSKFVTVKLAALAGIERLPFTIRKLDTCNFCVGCVGFHWEIKL
jgi:hypothetical protein